MRPNPITCVCVQCGAAFTTIPSRVAAGRGRFCGRACAGVYRSTARVTPTAVRFWKKVDQSGGPDACWVWTAGRGGTMGYGSFQMGTYRNTHHVRAHRMAWELTNGPIPAGKYVCHRCDNPPCCNPAHLFLGTQGDNLRDMYAKGRR
jgi:hypothetical protein